MDATGVHYQEMSGKRVWEQSSTGSIIFDNVEVTDADVLGEVHDGFKVMVTTLNGGRLFIASLALASLSFALDKTRVYAEERIQFDNQPIGRFQRVQDAVIDMDIALERNITWLMHLCSLYDQDRLTSELTALAMEVCGGVACLDEFGLIRHHNDLFVTRVGEGSNFALKDLIIRPLRKG
jgi:alkylation response protein AidB-like acyl-CoA dehydrogenase